MELYNNLRIVRKHLWLVLLTTLVAAGTTAVVDRLHHERTVYVSTADLIINPNVPHRGIIPTNALFLQTQGGRIDMQTLASTYDAYLTGQGFATEVVRQYKLPMTPDELASGTTTQLIPGTLVLQISVTSHNKDVVQGAATDVALRFVQDDLDAARAAGIPQAASVPGLADATAAFWTAQITRIQQELLAVLHDSTLGATEKSRRVIALQNSLQDALSNQAKGQAAVTGNVQPQDQSNLAASTQSQAAFVAQYGNPPTVLVRSVLVANIILLATAAGFVIGLMLALLREYLDNSLRSADEVTEMLGLPVLATIGFFKTRSRTLAKAGARDGTPARDGSPAPDFRPGVARSTRAAEEALVTVTKPFHAASEVFRNLRTGILFAGATRTVRTIVVTSAVPGEGKSVIAANLAIVMAQAGERVILVDADMRRPAQHALFGLSAATGLSTLYLEDEADVHSAVINALRPTAVPNLRLLDAGQIPPNPAELLASARTSKVVEILSAQANVVIFDTPAMGLLTDAVIVGSHADATLVVIRARSTRRDLVKMALAKLAAVDARVVGVVLNMADEPGLRYARYYQRAQRAFMRSAAAGTAGDKP